MAPFRARISFLAVCLAASMSSACATLGALPREVAEGEVVDMGEWAVAAPPGDSWTVEKDPKGSVTFMKKKVDFLTSRVKGLTNIAVIRNQVLGDAPLGDVEAEAEKLREHELSGMRDMGVALGLYELSDVRKEKVSVDGRTWYVLRYRQRHPQREPPMNVDAALHAWYPPGFAERRVFYLVHVSDWREDPTTAAIDPAQAEAVLRSLTVK